MANTTYENFIIENKLSDILATQLDCKTLMTVDTSLAENAGMIKKIHTYSYTGTVQDVDMGDANTSRGAVSFTTKSYEVGVSQQTWDYYDEEIMTDPQILDAGISGGATVMVNDMTDKFFDELENATLECEYDFGETISYVTVVDAIALMNLEDETGLNLIIGTDLKADIRKDPDFKSKELGAIIASGAIGTICGIPVIVSKKVPAKTAYVLTKQAITLFTKVDSEVEQTRDIETRKNTVVMRKVNLVALTNATKVVAIIEGADPDANN